MLHNCRRKPTLLSLVGDPSHVAVLPLPLLRHRWWFPLLTEPFTSPLPFLTNSCPSFHPGLHVTSLARPSLVPECCCTLPGSHDTFSHCCYLFSPSPPTGPTSSMRDCILSTWLPGEGKPLNMPRHLSDSQQSGSANKHPGWVLRGLGGHEESRRRLPFIGSISSFVPY